MTNFMQSFQFVKLYIFLCLNIELIAMLEIPIRKIKNANVASRKSAENTPRPTLRLIKKRGGTSQPVHESSMQPTFSAISERAGQIFLYPANPEFLSYKNMANLLNFFFAKGWPAQRGNQRKNSGVCWRTSSCRKLPTNSRPPPPPTTRKSGLSRVRAKGHPPKAR
jgi:hypothetical protein